MTVWQSTRLPTRFFSLQISFNSPERVVKFGGCQKAPVFIAPESSLECEVICTRVLQFKQTSGQIFISKCEKESWIRIRERDVTDIRVTSSM